ncbi:hypothetical protein AB0E69_35020 [Kribbella sp. NPDC026611]|uniref:hypothetical protein n=1 Tax=Kribbella sp. NPDC026611 TaxID=3154911 RepID=UPI0034087F19
MPFNAKKLRVVLPAGDVVGADEPRVLPVALDFGAADIDTLECFAAAHQIVTDGWCWSDSCMDQFSEPKLLYAVPAEMLPALREALEAQLVECDRAQEALSQSQIDQ